MLQTVSLTVVHFNLKYINKYAVVCFMYLQDDHVCFTQIQEGKRISMSSKMSMLWEDNNSIFHLI